MHGKGAKVLLQMSCILSANEPCVNPWHCHFMGSTSKIWTSLSWKKALQMIVKLANTRVCWSLVQGDLSHIDFWANQDQTPVLSTFFFAHPNLGIFHNITPWNIWESRHGSLLASKTKLWRCATNPLKWLVKIDHVIMWRLVKGNFVLKSRLQSTTARNAIAASEKADLNSFHTEEYLVKYRTISYLIPRGLIYNRNDASYKQVPSWHCEISSQCVRPKARRPSGWHTTDVSCCGFGRRA